MLGTVRQEERGIVRTFDGIIELVAILESCLAHESPEKDS
ncbi:hypothetical protein CLV71_12134 [Actinophytocola oryzae]|uniref:Uncharacterized protein n=2 Tax=Actinophytocola oryzae TaxID=502181 RepID=A0A4R7UW18_9PSEU|nr:hypothetical protein CLV71_12134 [Actinophytocola oryzae]